MDRQLTVASTEPHLTGSGEQFIRVAGVGKSFSGVAVLHNVSVELRRGEVHALLGANGSGKSTLIKVLTGFHQPLPGARAWIDGLPAKFTRNGLARADGQPFVTRAVHQDLGLIGRLSAVDNIAMIAGYRTGPMGRVRWTDQAAVTRELLEAVGQTDLDIYRALDDCEPLERTQVALARALAGWQGQPGLLVLDEPTAALPDDQVKRLFSIIRSIRDGGVTVLYVSHRLSEVFEVADRVTALREGQVVGTRPVAQLSHESLVDMMMGPVAVISSRDEPETNQPQQPPYDTGRGANVILTVQGLSTARIRDLSFTLAKGEALGFAGLVGSGLGDLPYALVGATKATAGLIQAAGRSVPATKMTPLRATSLGIGLVPGQRMSEGLIGSWSVSENVTLPQVRRFQRGGWLRRRDELRFGRRWVRDLAVSPADPQKPVRLLSGGNQQKVLLAKWLGVSTSVLVAAEPTAGVDVHAKELIYEELVRQRERGLPIIVCSTDIMDLVKTCTRVIVLSRGRPVGEFYGVDVTEDNILHLALHRDSASTSNWVRI